MQDEAITSFSGLYSWLSNMHLIEIAYKNKLYPSSEHLYQSLKCKNQDEAEMIRVEPNPYEAKRLGRKIRMKDNWDDIKEKAMWTVLSAKFNRGTRIGEALVLTGNAEIIEGNFYHDNFWGDCKCLGCSLKLGQNVLGRLLMQKREELLT